MILEKQDNGSLLITDFINERYIIKKVYYFTPIKAAKKDFLKYTKKIKKNWVEYLTK